MRAATDDSLLLSEGIPTFQKWADEHPINNMFFLRLSTRPLISEYAHDEYKGGLAGVSEMNETLADLTNRLDAYMETASKQFRWQSAIILEDLELNPRRLSLGPYDSRAQRPLAVRLLAQPPRAQEGNLRPAVG